MKRSFIFPLYLFAMIALILSACAPAAQPTATDEPANGNTGIANPASKYCEEKGGKVNLITASDGSVSGTCEFPDGSQCDEWAYYRGECKPGDQPKGMEKEATLDPNAQTKVVEAVKAKLAEQLKVEASAITMESAEQVNWNDGCLELPIGDEMCTMAIVPGFRVVLASGGQTYTFHTNLNGTTIRQEAVK